MNYSLKIKKMQFGVAIGIAIFLTSCAPTMPIMSLQHQSQSEGYSFSSKGEIEVMKFEDARHPEEKTGDKFKKSSDKSIIWSKQTFPLMNEFIQSTMEQEIKESGMFSIANNCEYKLSGKLISVKNSHKTGAGAKIGSGLGIATCLASVAGAGLIPVVALAVPTVVCVAVSKDKVSSIAIYEVTLSKNGQKVWNDKINVIINEKLSAGLKSKDKIAKGSAAILDRTITQAARKMLKKIDEEVKFENSQALSE